MKRKSTTGIREEERECEDVTPASKRPRDNSSSASTAMSSPLSELSTNASFPTQSMVNDYTSTDAKEHGADHGAVASEGLRFSAGNDDESHVNRRPLQDINGIETSSTADEKPPPKKRLNTKFICSQILEDLLESNASPEFLEEASLLFLNTLIPDIEKADDDIKQDLEVLHEMIVNDGGSCLDRLLYLYGYFNMEHHFTLLHAELEKEGQSAEALFTDGVKERIVASFIREGEAAKKNNEYCFVLKGCKEKESDEDLYNGEAIASIEGRGRGVWLGERKTNQQDGHTYTGVRIRKDKLYNRKSTTPRSTNHIAEYEYNSVSGLTSSPITAQCYSFIVEKMGELLMMALYPHRTMNRNCFYVISRNTKKRIHQAGVVRVKLIDDRTGFISDWCDNVLRRIGATEDQLLTLAPHKSGEPYHPHTAYHRYFGMLHSYFTDNEYKPNQVWVVDPKQCDDYDPKSRKSKMYDYWSSRIYGLTSKNKIKLLPCQLADLASIGMFPNDKEHVALVRKAQTQRRLDQARALADAKKAKKNK